VDALLRDLRYALRTLRKTPGFTFFAVLTLALGIGATSTIFSVVNTVLLSPPPYGDPARLVTLYENDLAEGNLEFPVAPANFHDWQRDARSFAGMAASRNQSVNLTGDGEPERIPGSAVSGNYFQVLGVQPRLGRAFTTDEDAPGAGQVVVISDALWRRRFGGDPAIVGQAIELNGRPHTVIGIAPPSMRLPSSQTELWIPLALDEQARGNRGGHSMGVVARLAPGATLEQARTEMRTIGERISAAYPEVQSGFNVTVQSLGDDLIGDARTPLLVLVGAVAFVLLICCANVANLMLARAASRQKEIAIRSAIGAGRSHIVRQLLAEAAVLALAGGLGGLLLAVWGVDLLVAVGPRELPRLDDVAVDGRVVGFALGVSLLTGVLFGVLPAVHASRADLNETLKDGLKGSSGGPGRARARQALLVAEVAISLTLLVGAGLMLKSMSRLTSVDPGFESAGLVVGGVPLSSTKYDSSATRVAFYDQLHERLRTSPGVDRAGFVSALPLSGALSISGYWIEGKTPRGDNSQVPTAYSYLIAGDYFETMEIPLKDGRLFAASDRAGAPLVAVVNETLARQEFPGESPIGKRLQFGPPESPFVEIVGVVADTRHAGLGDAVPAQMYLPYAQNAFGGMTAVVRGRDAATLTATLRREVRAVDADQPVSLLRTMDEVIATGVARPRFITLLLGTFAALALVLAVVGIYGVVAYSVAQRTQEFGIRMALGADARRVLTGVVGQAARVTAIGVAIGVAAALVMSRGLAELLFEVQASDPATYAGIAAVLLAATVVASWIPARRATRVPPIAALRQD
jgi:putative ABC transport system permease protein